MTTLIAALFAVSFAVAWLGTAAIKKLAPRMGFVDKPGHRKIHYIPKPLGGGVAIFLGTALPLLAAVIWAWLPGQLAHIESVAPAHALAGGIRLKTPQALAMLLAMLAMHILGLLDDRKALGPYVKLVAQLLIVTGLVVSSNDLRLLTGLGTSMSIVLTILWITAITNAFNFLDNMDGLSAGVAAVCTAAFMVTALSIGQFFVAATLAMLLGALVAFLCFNFPPATIFMGDSGSLLIGLVLGILTVRTTFLPRQTDLAAGWYALFAPVIVLALPLYDLIVVSAIRLSRGKSPFVGDTNHFSHRLVARGMSRRTAVLSLYLITATTSMAAILLPLVSGWGALLIVAQTLLILGVVALLEQHPLAVPAATGTAAPPEQRDRGVPSEISRRDAAGV